MSCNDLLTNIHWDHPIWRGRMADGMLREQFLEGLKEAEHSPANFQRILSLAKGRLLAIKDAPRQAPDLTIRNAAENVAADFEGFCDIVEGQALIPLLVDIGIIDDDSLDRSKLMGRENRDSVLRRQFGRNEPPKAMFAAVACGYGRFAQDDRLIRVWHRATADVVQDGFSLVGTPELYRYIHIHSQLTPDDLQRLTQQKSRSSLSEAVTCVLLDHDSTNRGRVAVAMPTLF